MLATRDFSESKLSESKGLGYFCLNIINEHNIRGEKKEKPHEANDFSNEHHLCPSVDIVSQWM